MMLLRFYSPSALDPLLPCLFGPLGKKSIPSTNAWRLVSKAIPIIVEHDDIKPYPIFTISRDVQRDMEGAGLRRASSLIRQWEYNELEQLVLRCIAIFVHGIETADSLDRLVFTLAAAETLLLGDSNDPIQETVALRLGYLCADNARDRQQVRSLLRTAYGQRSRYLHHGKEQRDMEVLRELQLHVWTAINHAIELSEHLKTKHDLFHVIEQCVLS
ncbi:MAG: hypothetical protein ABI876_15145 [Bacteroidota bacterium]